MSISKRNLLQTISRIIPDDLLREQLIDLHLGKLTEDQIREIREEREREAEMILQMFPKDVSSTETIALSNNLSSYDNINGKPETPNYRDSGNQDAISLDQVIKRDTT